MSGPFLLRRIDPVRGHVTMVRKSYILFAFLALIPGLVLPAFAAGGKGFGGFRGLNLDSISVSERVSFQHSSARPDFIGAIGFRLSPAWRVGGEFSYRTDSAAGGDRTSRLALMNIYYDFETGNDTVKPFISVGAGLSSRTHASSFAHHDDTGIVMQAGGGLNILLNKNLAMSGQYRFMTTESMGESAIDPDDAHEIMLGITYKLPHKNDRTGGRGVLPPSDAPPPPQH